jgi:hypothetical protein
MQHVDSRSASRSSTSLHETTAVPRRLDSSSHDERSTLYSNRNTADLDSDTAAGLIDLVVASERQAINFIARQAADLAHYQSKAFDEEVTDRLYSTLANTLNPHSIETLHARTEENNATLANTVVPAFELLLRQNTLASARAHGPVDETELGFRSSPQREEQRRAAASMTTGVKLPARAAVAYITERVASVDGDMQDRAKRLEHLRAEIADGRRQDAENELEAKSRRRRKLHRIALAQQEHDELKQALMAEMGERSQHDRQLLDDVKGIREQHATLKSIGASCDVLRLEMRAVAQEHEKLAAAAEDGANIVMRGGVPSIADGAGEPDDDADPTEGDPRRTSSDGENSRHARTVPSSVRVDYLRDQCRDLGYDLSAAGDWRSRIAGEGPTALNPAAELMRGATYVDPAVVLATTNFDKVAHGIVDVADEFLDDGATVRYLQRRKADARRVRTLPSLSEEEARRRHERPNGDPPFLTPPVPAALEADRYRALEEAALEDLRLVYADTATAANRAASRRREPTPEVSPRPPRDAHWQVDHHEESKAETEPHAAAGPAAGAPELRLRRQIARDRHWRASMTPAILRHPGHPADASEDESSGSDGLGPLTAQIRNAALHRAQGRKKGVAAPRRSRPSTPQAVAGRSSSGATRHHHHHHREAALVPAAFPDGRQRDSPRTKPPAALVRSPSSSPSPVIPGLEHLVDDVSSLPSMPTSRQPASPHLSSPQSQQLPLPLQPAYVDRGVGPERPHARKDSGTAAMTEDTTPISDLVPLVPPRKATATLPSTRNTHQPVEPPSRQQRHDARGPIAQEESPYVASRQSIPTYLELMQMHDELDAGDVGTALRTLRLRQVDVGRRLGDDLLAARGLTVPKQSAGDADQPHRQPDLPGFHRSTIAGTMAARRQQPVLFSERRRASSDRRSVSSAYTDAAFDALRRPAGLRAQLDVMRLGAAEAVAELRNLSSHHLGLRGF